METITMELAMKSNLLPSQTNQHNRKCTPRSHKTGKTTTTTSRAASYKCSCHKRADGVTKPESTMVKFVEPTILCINNTEKTSPLSISKFSSEAIVKSLSYVHSLAAQHILKRLLQPSTYSRPSSASGQSLPTLSSLLDKCFSSQLYAASIQEMVEKDSITSTISKLSKVENFDEETNLCSLPMMFYNGVGLRSSNHHQCQLKMMML